MPGPRIAVEPTSGRHDSLVAAVRDGGGVVVDVAEAEALVWADAARPDLLPAVLGSNRGLRWVQLPYAGIENFSHLLDGERIWTCGKGVYAAPVAEHALALLLAGFRNLVEYGRARRWEPPAGRNLLGAKLVILGGGEITRELLGLLSPFGASTTVVRRRPEPLGEAHATVGIGELHAVLPGADAVVLALALTPETEGVIGAEELDLMAPHSWLVNVARGRHVDTEALVEALASGAIGGAALDVTEPEPLPADHPLWSAPNCLVTPHVGNTPEMGVPLLAARVTENVRRYRSGEPLLGLVDVEAGY